MTACALIRTESRGVHFRTDFPQPNPGLAHAHTTWHDSQARLESVIQG
jgi:aspartate oxidase